MNGLRDISMTYYTIEDMREEIRLLRKEVIRLKVKAGEEITLADIFGTRPAESKMERSA